MFRLVWNEHNLYVQISVEWTPDNNYKESNTYPDIQN